MDLKNRPPAHLIFEKIVRLLDEAYRIPGTNIRVGWDAIIGLVPGLGEAIMLVIQCGLVYFAALNYQIPNVVLARMIANVLIDSGIGAIPFVGDIFDVFFKANTRNLALVREVQTSLGRGNPVPVRRHVFYFAAVGAVLLTVVAALMILTFLVVSTIWKWIAG